MWSSLLVGWTCAVRRRVPRPQFIDKPQKKQITSEQKQRVKKLLLERISLRGITRSLEISMTWLQKFVNSLYRSVPLELKVREISDLEIEIECDELWSYVNSKENPVYIWLAIALGEPADCWISFRRSRFLAAKRRAAD